MSTAFDPSTDTQRTEQPLTDREKAVRDLFVSEYMKDFDPFRACVRMGFLASFAPDQAKIFMQDGYVLRQIDHLTRKVELDEAADKAAMLENLRFLAHNGSAPSRTAATKAYMEARGYIARGPDSGEAAAAALVEALEKFADKAPT